MSNQIEAERTLDAKDRAAIAVLHGIQMRCLSRQIVACRDLAAVYTQRAERLFKEWKQLEREGQLDGSIPPSGASKAPRRKRGVPA